MSKSRNKRFGEWVVDEVASTLRRHHLEKAVRWIDVRVLARLLCLMPRAKIELMLELGPIPSDVVAPEKSP